MGAGETLRSYANQYWELYNEIGEDKRHTTEQYRVLKDHLEQLVKTRYLKEFVVDPRNQETEQGARPRGNPLPPLLRVIEVIHAAPRGTQIFGKREVLAMASTESYAGEQPPEKKLKYTREPIAFNDDNLEGMIQPHDDVLVVATRINGFIVKRMLIDQGSGTEVMYPDLFKGLDLKSEDLFRYDAPLLGFDGHMVILEEQIMLPVNMEGKEVMMTFIMVTSFSPYTVIKGRGFMQWGLYCPPCM
ncbi:uncharacterized protein LOC126697421 [Quercus robur]|uniref:uncharacterized protein LOC126697421 n=1 Tax=Quercus robur TaxID=38942 RepID=UPI0021611C6A|nr:uncharacterized protein LOC126697421 [Quercus robur]